LRAACMIWIPGRCIFSVTCKCVGCGPVYRLKNQVERNVLSGLFGKGEPENGSLSGLALGYDFAMMQYHEFFTYR